LEHISTLNIKTLCEIMDNSHITSIKRDYTKTYPIDDEKLTWIMYYWIFHKFAEKTIQLANVAKREIDLLKKKLIIVKMENYWYKRL